MCVCCFLTVESVFLFSSQRDMGIKDAIKPNVLPYQQGYSLRAPAPPGPIFTLCQSLYEKCTIIFHKPTDH